MKALGIGLISCLVLLSACGHKTPPLTEQEKKVITELTTNMQPRCVGRYLIDLPARVEVRGSAKLNGVMVNAEPKEQRRFEHEMRWREEELKATKSMLDYPRVLFDYGSVHGTMHTQYFVSLGDPAEFNDARRIIEAYKWDRGYQLSLKIEASDWTESKYKDAPIVKNDPVKSNVPQKLRLAFDLIERLQGRPEDVIPTEPGACFVGGFLQGKAVSEEEEISVFFRLTEKPDAKFSWSSFANIRDETDTLLPRIRKAGFQEALKEAEGRVLRLGSVDLVSGMKIDEALMQALSYAVPGVQGFQFTLETNYRGGAQSPKVLLDMDITSRPTSLIESDQVKQSSVSEAEAVALWDTVSRTLRPRPNGF